MTAASITVHTVSRCTACDGWIGTASTLCASPAANSWSRPVADAHRDHARGEQHDVAAREGFQVRAVEHLGPGEPRVMPVQHAQQRGFPGPVRRGQAGYHHPVPDPHTRIPGEDQVRQRIEDEVVPVEELVGQAPPGGQLPRRDAGDQRLGQQLGFEAVQMVAEHVTELVAEPRIIDRRRDGGVPGPLVLQRVLQQFGEVEHFHAMIPEGLAEAVVLLLGPVDPGQPVEQQPVAAARGQPPQLGTGAVDQDGPQPANFTVHPVRVRHKYPRHYCRAAARMTPRREYHHFHG
jgi:hypothetical protein